MIGKIIAYNPYSSCVRAWIKKLCEKGEKMKVKTGRCDSCEIMYINGVRCHETGCPEEWKDETRECEWCGNEFTPDERDQVVCDESCAEAYFR